MSSNFLSKDIIYINSRNRNSGTSNNFTIDFTKQVKNDNNYDSATLLSFYCPISYYLINSNNNTFILNEGIFTTTITIPLGNYTINNLILALNTSLLSAHYTYTITFSNITAKLTFNVTGNAGVQPVFIFTNLLNEIIGFEDNNVFVGKYDNICAKKLIFKLMNPLF